MIDALLGPVSSFMSSVTWTLGSATYANLTKKYPPFVINFNRAMIALPIYLLIIFGLAGSIELGISEFAKVTSVNMIWLLVSIFASYAFADVLFLWSTQELGVPGALAISAIYPIWSALAGFFLVGQRLQHIQMIGLVAVVGGLAIVILSGRPKLKGVQHHRAYFKGVGLAIATSILWALNTFAIMRGGAGISPFVGNFFRMMFALCLCPLFATFMGQRGSVVMATSTYRRHGWVFAFEAVGGSSFFMYGLTHTSLAIASALSSLAPAIAVIVAWGKGREKVSLLKAIGIFIVVIGVILLVQEGG